MLVLSLALESKKIHFALTFNLRFLFFQLVVNFDQSMRINKFGEATPGDLLSDP